MVTKYLKLLQFFSIFLYTNELSFSSAMRKHLFTKCVGETGLNFKLSMGLVFFVTRRIRLLNAINPKITKKS